MQDKEWNEGIWDTSWDNLLCGGTVKILAHFPTTPRPAIRYGYSSSSVTSR